MARATAADIFRAFERRAVRLESLTGEGMRLRGQGRVTVGSLDALFESALLNLYTAFELFVEDLFYSVLLGDSGIPSASGVVTFSDRAQAEAVLLGGRDFLRWLPLDTGAIPRAHLVLEQGHPFDRLERHPQESATLDEMRLLRNAIAHDSGSARAKVAALTAGLRPRRRHPAGLLQDVQQGVTQHSNYSTVVRLVAAALAEPDDVRARNSLSPEKPYSSGAAPGPGRYECTRCRRRTTIRSKRQELFKCSACQRAHVKGQKEWRRIYR